MYLLMGGGMDSAVALAIATELRNPEEGIVAVHFDYGQEATMKERDVVRALAQHYGVSFVGYRLPTLRGMNIGFGDHYVPHRNLVLISVAASFAMRAGHYEVGGGWQSSGTACPDVQPGFMRALETALIQGAGCPFELWAPLLFHSKGEVVSDGNELGVPWDLTWSCFKGGPEPCGECVGCLRRNNVLDH